MGAELTAPEPLSRHTEAVGMPFLAVELVSRDALRRARPDHGAYRDLFRWDGAYSVYAYTRDVDTETPEVGTDFQARLFTGRMIEDPPTGSATAAVAALLADLSGEMEVHLRVGQGVDMGRPSLMHMRTNRKGHAVTAFIGGRCVEVMAGSIALGA